MVEKTSNSISQKANELGVILAISKIVTQNIGSEEGLQKIINLARTIFIFDNVVLYRSGESHGLEPSFARAVGRGRSTEADLAWGEATANEAITSKQIVVRKEVIGDYSVERMRLRYYLGLPLNLKDNQLGALVFIRYGGPPFTEEQTQIADFFSTCIAQLMEHEQLVSKLSTLESERRLDRLQDDFVATISHELRTPLGFIKGYATTLLREDTTWSKDTRREFLMIIDEETDRLRELIDNLLDSSRLQTGTLRMKFQPIRLDTMLRDISLRAHSLYEDMPIELKLKNNNVQIQADPTRLAQVFDNLLSNVSKYAPGSKVTMTLAKENKKAHITVSDQGPGIPEIHLENIFTRFFRVPNETSSIRGTGLGLFICRRIVRTHGGEIKAESKVGKGTTFHIYLPCEELEINKHSQ
jgi:signal transduction histidine kinase